MEKYCIFAAANQMVDLAQLVRVPDCGSEGRGFESHIPPWEKEVRENLFFYCCFKLEWEKIVILHLELYGHGKDNGDWFG